jgi:hypothetical protein
VPKKRGNQTSFKKSHKSAGGICAQGQLRHDVTVELVSQLNEFDHDCDHLPPGKRLRLNRLVHNLLEKACHDGDVYADVLNEDGTPVLDKDGNPKRKFVRPGSGDSQCHPRGHQSP